MYRPGPGEARFDASNASNPTFFTPLDMVRLLYSSSDENTHLILCLDTLSFSRRTAGFACRRQPMRHLSKNNSCSTDFAAHLRLARRPGSTSSSGTRTRLRIPMDVNDKPSRQKPSPPFFLRIHFQEIEMHHNTTTAGSLMLSYLLPVPSSCHFNDAFIVKDCIVSLSISNMRRMEGSFITQQCS